LTTEILLECALAIQPMVQYLYRNGIIAVEGFNNEIHCNKDFFFSAFKGAEITVKEHSAEFDALYVEHEGAKFFALVGKEKKDESE